MEKKEGIELLAVKLGTTAEYLWGVLLTQSTVFAYTTAFEILTTILFGVILYRVHKHFIKKEIYNEYEEGAVIPMLIAGIVWGFLLLVAFFAIGDVFSAIVNPEYWALKQILGAK